MPPESGQLTAIFEGLPAGFLILAAGGDVAWANATAAEHLGRPLESLAGVPFVSAVMPELRGSPLEEIVLGRADPGKQRESAQVEIQRSFGPRVLEVCARRLGPNGSGGVVVYVGDRTAITEDEKRRERAESLASVGELAAGLAHEVNNPLASIKSFAQLLAREASTAEQRHALELIVDESDRISRAVASVVAFARQQGAGGREPVSISSLVQQVIEVRRYSLETAGIEIRLDLDSSISPVMGEAGALQQVILTLVTRAETDLALRRSDRMLIIRSRESTEGVVLYVVDNGPGIPRSALPHLFDPYSAASEGQGMELATSARIVRDHGGYMLAESEPGRGSAFFVRLPRAGAPPISAPEAGVIPPAPTAKRSLRILVADDEPTLRLAITLFLTRRGHVVTQAADAYEALRLAKETDFDVALVDARMPGDGLALLEQLDALPSLAQRTALMTGDLGRARTTQGIPTDRPYLVKPFDMNEAVNLIEKLAENDSD